MSWAKSVLPMFTGDSSEKLRIAPDQVQIDTTHFRPQAPPKSALSRTRLAVNRTAVISDIAGQDIHSHQGTLKRLIEELATWLRNQGPNTIVPGGQKMAREFNLFRRKIPRICADRDLHPNELTFGDYAEMVVQYLALNA